MPIVIQNLFYEYSPGTPFAVEALSDVSLTIEDGAFVGIIGHTGSGKSTLAAHLNGLEEAQRGSVTVDNVQLTGKYDKRAVRTKVGMVFQYPEYQLFEDTVLLDVCFGPKNMGLSEEEQKERAKYALSLMGLDFDTYAQRSPFELSGGQKRRVAIAGVLAMQPKYLVLDEPAAGLDPISRRSLLELIRSMHCETGMAVVMISHSMDDIALCAQHVVVMNRGKAVMQGTPREIFKEKEYLRSIGLDVPVAAELADRLQARGIQVEPYMDANEMAIAIQKAVQHA